MLQDKSICRQNCYRSILVIMLEISVTPMSWAFYHYSRAKMYLKTKKLSNLSHE